MALGMIPDEVRDWLQVGGYNSILSTKPVGGGCINNGMVLETISGKTFFLKTNGNSPEDMFAREAEGLKILNVDDGPRIPIPYLWRPGFILMEDLASTSREQDYWSNFGRKLACLHQHSMDRFGFPHDNYIGSTPQVNPWTEDGYEFFGQSRLTFQAHLAHEAGLLNQEELDAVENLVDHLPEIIPVQPASLIHGDLWGGNAITGPNGEPALIDPAVHYGWAEAELAMTTLFGSFPGLFYQAYQEVRPLEVGYQQRFPIYNLYHLLNHLNLFGMGYLGQVRSVLKRFRKSF